MSLIEWKDEFSVGVASVDFEHRELIDLINKLHGLLGDDATLEQVAAMLGEIFAQISAHFALEEKYMRETRYPHYSDHKDDHEALLDELRSIMDRVTLAVEFIFLFTILAGLAVLYAAIQANQDERRFENAVLRTLGAQRKTLLLGLFTEFATLGALSGLLAGLAATSLAWLLAETIFQFEYQFDISVALTGIISGTLIVVIAGLLGTRSVLAHPPVRTLREGTA